MRILSIILLLLFLDSCTGRFADRREAFRYNQNGKVERKVKINKSDNSWSWNKLTQTTKDKQGNIIYHFLKQEWQPTTGIFLLRSKDPGGQCRIYYVVDPKTDIIIDWGYEKDSNPDNCQHTI